MATSNRVMAKEMRPAQNQSEKSWRYVYFKVEKKLFTDFSLK